MTDAAFTAAREITWADGRKFRTEAVAPRTRPQAGSWSTRSFVTVTGARVPAHRVLGWL